MRTYAIQETILDIASTYTRISQTVRQNVDFFIQVFSFHLILQDAGWQAPDSHRAASTGCQVTCALVVPVPSAFARFARDAPAVS